MAASSSSLAAPTDMMKLTVPQLKLMCKERRITGYSKLSKNALIQKLSEFVNHSNVSAHGPNPTVHLRVPTTSSVATESTRCHGTPVSPQGQSDRSKGLPHECQNRTSAETDTRSSAPSPTTVRKPVSETPKDILSKMLPPQAVTSCKGPINASRNPIVSSSVNSFPTVNSVLPVTAGLSRNSKRSFTSFNEPDTTESSLKKKKKVRLTKPHSSTAIPPANEAHRSAQSSSSSSYTKPIPVLTGSGRRQLATFEVQPVHMGFRTTSASFKAAHRPHAVPAPLSSIENATGSIMAIDVSVSRSVATTGFDLQQNTVTAPAPPPAKRFRPLVVRKKTTLPGSQLMASSPVTVIVPRPISTTAVSRLDFTPTPVPPLLVPIMLPPSLSQRKHVKRWSILLSAISDRDRRACVLASRMLRYSVYLSAVQILTENFAGRRLAILMQDYPLNMTNMWPYLRLRQHELITRTETYQKSFLGKFLKNHNPISEKLWTSPDNERQVVVALRFVLTRLWFLASIGGGGKDPLAWSRGVVVDSQEIVEGEIWSITVDFASHTEAFYVLESTCEVVGRSPVSSCPTSVSDASLCSGSELLLRSDWASYIAHRVLPPSMHDSPPRSLLHHLKWSNHEEYEKGISKLWLNKVSREEEAGREKRIVAERYVFACVVGNSVSGTWMSSIQMAQEFSGLPSQGASVTVKAPQVNLYLPAHHLVESLHFTTSKGTPLHDALAIVQTPGREYIILKDNGMQVGCEEDGVGEVWRKILACDCLGVALS